MLEQTVSPCPFRLIFRNLEASLFFNVFLVASHIKRDSLANLTSWIIVIYKDKAHLVRC